MEVNLRLGECLTHQNCFYIYSLPKKGRSSDKRRRGNGDGVVKPERNIEINMITKNLYIIAGCNGAGKTTASYDILPALLDCKEFVNADEIAKGLSPFQPETVSFEDGRIMLQRIEDLLKKEADFAFETTLATRSFAGTVSLTQQKRVCGKPFVFLVKQC